MKILFTKSEYRTLFDMIYIAEWMLTAFEKPSEPGHEAYTHLAQKIFSHAKEMGSTQRELPFLPTRRLIQRFPDHHWMCTEPTAGDQQRTEQQRSMHEHLLLLNGFL